MTTEIDDASSGLKLVQQAFAAGGFARGIGRTLGIRGESAEQGKVVLVGSPNEDHYNPLGTVHGGYAATMLDGAIALAVQTSLPAGTGYATLDLKVTYIRAMTAASGPIRAEGRIIHMGRRMAATEGTLTDKDGRLCAHATATCMITGKD
ncbi:PaaI family thioesterase [Tardiphaga sp. 42S5]|uniref:PaaI family thioesterase n=1 Tax=Tardiphaga sp. 42S5 TaxID=1404799 RepID=UPI002A5AE62A|nr:PaaI family thioesterase [Tardiphaga sp. 42S5]WPO43055.1 PaaI family thioesterase [Tardiphaga sp. 42S5]